MAITVGFEWADEYKDFCSFLKNALSKLTEVKYKENIITCLGWITFLWCEHETETHIMLHYLNQIVTQTIEEGTESQMDSFLVSIMDVISLLLTTVSDEFILDTFLSDSIHNLEALMLSTNPQVKIAAAEPFALICSVVKQDQLEKDEEYSIFFFNGYLSSVKAMLEHLTEAANGDTREVNKKDRTAVRRDFGPILKTFQHGVEPTVELTIKNQQFSFEGWEQFLQLKWLKAILLEGFQQHFGNNIIVSNILGVSVEAEAPQMTTGQKKSFLLRSSRLAKQRKQRISKNRKIKRADNENDY